MLTTQQESALDDIGASMCNWIKMLRTQKAKPGHVQTQTDETIMYNMEIVIGDLLALKQSLSTPVPPVADNAHYHDYALGLLDKAEMAVSALSRKLDLDCGEAHPRAVRVNDTLTRFAEMREHWMK